MKLRHDASRTTHAATFTAVLLAGLAVVPAFAADFQWQGTCGTSNWHQTCTTGLCAEDPDRWWTSNNWGELTCGSTPVFPGAADNAYCLAGGIDLVDAAAIDTLTIGAGSELAVENYPSSLVVGSALTNTGNLVIRNGGQVSVANCDIENDGTITLRYGGTYGGGSLWCSAGAELVGTGDLVFDSDGHIQGPGTLTQRPGHTIRGYGGSIEAPLENEGTVNADVANYWLELTGAAKTNAGTIKATNGAHLDIHTTVDQSNGGELLADGTNSQIRLGNGATIIGGALLTANDGLFHSEGGLVTATFTDVINLGDVQIANGGTLAVTGSSLFNDGVIGLHYGGTWGGAHMLFENTMPLDGTGEVFVSDGHIDTAAGVTLTNTADHTIRGRGGSILADLVNEGTITAEYPPYALHISDKPKTNNGTMIAKNGAFLDIHTTINQGAAGQVLADGAGSQVRLAGGAVIVGGTLDSPNGGAFTCAGGNVTTTLTDVTNLGDVQFADGATVVLTGTTTNNAGTIGLYYGGGSGGAHMWIEEDVTLQGSGELFLSDGDVDSAPGVTLTNAADHTIRGRGGNVLAALVNDGTVTAEFAPYAVGISDKPKTNNGTMIAKNGALLDIHTTVTQGAAGRLVADGAGSQVRLAGGSAIVGGTIDTPNDGRLTCGGGGVTATLTDVTNLGDVRFSNGATAVLDGTTTNNGGTIGLYYGGGHGGGHLRFDSDMTISGTGDMYLDSGDTETAPGVVFTNGPGHTLHGYGRPTFSVAMINNGIIRATSPYYWDRRLRLFAQAPGITNNGTIEVLPECFMEINDAQMFVQLTGETIVDGQLGLAGGPFDLQGGVLSGTGIILGGATSAAGSVEPGSPTGTLQFQGDYEQSAAGTLRIELGGMQASEFDRLSVTGTATIDGELAFEAVDGFNAPAGAAFVVLSASSIVGDFNAITGPSHFDVVTTDTTVALTSTRLPGDADLDDVVDLDDYAAAHDCLSGPGGSTTLDCRPADNDGDHDVDLRDFALLQAAFTGQP